MACDSQPGLMHSVLGDFGSRRLVNKGGSTQAAVGGEVERHWPPPWGTRTTPLGEGPACPGCGLEVVSPSPFASKLPSPGPPRTFRAVEPRRGLYPAARASAYAAGFGKTRIHVAFLVPGLNPSTC